MNHVKHYTDISIAELVELAIQRNEGKLAANGALTVKRANEPDGPQLIVLSLKKP